MTVEQAKDALQPLIEGIAIEFLHDLADYLQIRTIDSKSDQKSGQNLLENTATHQLKSLSAELAQVAGEIGMIIRTVARNGEHLASTWAWLS